MSNIKGLGGMYYSEEDKVKAALFDRMARMQSENSLKRFVSEETDRDIAGLIVAWLNKAKVGQLAYDKIKLKCGVSQLAVASGHG